ncbi:MAG: hypothetical protein JO235_19655 [Chroococcidiopsidaceae cyanobacterium CP_BM_RX_35]|nr:hypothetical protein [Chroococcidiopsidaceae cyanobacterium CP_BM_RX_35]
MEIIKTLSNAAVTVAGLGLLTSMFATVGASSASAFSFSTTPHSSACDPNGCTSKVSGAVTVDFNGGAAPTSGFATYTGGAHIVSGSASGLYSAPKGDTTPFLAVGPSPNATPVTVNFAAPVDYFGLYLGTPDSYNSISFFNGSNSIASYTGNQFIAGISGTAADDATNPYVDFFANGSSEYFNRVVLDSTRQAFETDNHAYRAVSSVPEPSALLGVFAFAALGVNRRLKLIKL